MIFLAATTGFFLLRPIRENITEHARASELAESLVTTWNRTPVNCILIFISNHCRKQCPTLGPLFTPGIVNKYRFNVALLIDALIKVIKV